MASLFSLLYSLVAVITCMAYLPQIRVLLQAKAPLTGMSLATWLMWTASNAISFGYGVFCLQDFQFCLVTGIGLTLLLLVSGLLFYNNYIRFRPPQRARVSSMKHSGRGGQGGYSGFNGPYDYGGPVRMPMVKMVRPGEDSSL